MRRPLALLATTALLAAVTGCGGSTPEAVTYEVSGDGVAAADLTYTDGSTQTTQEMSATLPWSTAIDPADDALVYQVLAQNTGAEGTVTCRILVDGEVVTENTSEGAAAIATCEHTP